MNYRNASFFLMLFFWAVLGNTQVTGLEPRIFIPIWTGTTALGVSAMFQADGNVGLGTTHPKARLHSSTSAPNGFAILGQNTSTSQTTFPEGVVGTVVAPMGVGVYGDAISASGATVGPMA